MATYRSSMRWLSRRMLALVGLTPLAPWIVAAQDKVEAAHARHVRRYTANHPGPTQGDE